MRPLTTTSYAILGLLCVRPWSAYELAKQLGRSLRFTWPRAVSAIYAEPKNLVAHGLAAVSREPAGRRTKAVYSVTAEGRAAFATWLGEPSAPPQFESEAVLRVTFGELGTKDDLLGAIRSIADHADELRQLGARQAKNYLETGGPFPERLHVVGLATRFLADYVRMLSEWARWAEAEVEGWADVKPLHGLPTALERYRSIIGEEVAAEIDRAAGND